MITNLQDIEVCIPSLSLHMVCTHDVTNVKLCNKFIHHKYTPCVNHVHTANWYYCFTPSLHRANRVNQSKHFTKFANYLQRFCCDLVLVWTRFNVSLHIV